MAIRLGDIDFGVGADTRALTTSMQKLRSFGLKVDQVAKSQADGADKAAAALRRQEQAITSALQKVLNFNAAVRRAGGDKNLINEANAAWRKYNTVLTKTNLSALDMQRASERLNASLGVTKRQLSDFVANKKAQEVKSLSDHFKNLASVAVLTRGPLSGIAARITAFGVAAQRVGVPMAALLAGIAGMTFAIGRLGTAIVTNARKLNTARSQLEAVAGSSRLAEWALRDVTDIAIRSGQSLATTATQYAKFMAAAQGTNLEGKRSRDIFESVALTVGKLQLPAEQAEGIFRALEQIMSKGTVQAEELRGQLGDRLPGAFRIAADAMEVTTKELGEMMKRGEVLSEDFLPKFANQLRKVFNVGQDVDNFQAAIGRMQTAWSRFLDKLDDTLGVSRAVKAVMEAITRALDAMRENMDSIARILGAVAGGLVVAFSATIIARVMALVTALRAAAAAMLAFNVAALASPFAAMTALLGKLGVVLAGATAGLIAMDYAIQGSSDSFGQLIKDADEVIDVMERTGTALGGVAEQIRNTLADSVLAAKVELIDLKGQLADMQDSASVAFGRGALAVVPDAIMRQFGFDPQMLPGQMRERIAELERIVDQGESRLGRLNTRITAATNRGGGGSGGEAAVMNLDLPIFGDQDELDKQYKAVMKTNEMLDRTRQRIEALRTGGIPALEKLNAEFDRTDSIEQYAELVAEFEKSGRAAALSVDEFATAMERLEQAEKDAKRVQAAIDVLQDTGSKAFDRLGTALAEFTASAEVSFDGFKDVLRAVVNDLLETMFILTAINPIKNAIFGVGLPTISDVPVPFSGGASGSNIAFAAKGAVLNGPTAFATRGGITIGGEAGEEALMPLKRNSRGELGVSVSGSADRESAVNVTYNIDARGADQAAVMRLEQSLRRIDSSIEARALAASKNARIRNSRLAK